MATMTLKITNCYPGKEEQVTTADHDVPAPDFDQLADPDQLEEWAEDELFPLTGTGRETGDAAYFVEVVRAPDTPELDGRTFEWGL